MDSCNSLSAWAQAAMGPPCPRWYPCSQERVCSHARTRPCPTPGGTMWHHETPTTCIQVAMEMHGILMGNGYGSMVPWAVPGLCQPAYRDAGKSVECCIRQQRATESHGLAARKYRLQAAQTLTAVPTAEGAPAAGDCSLDRYAKPEAQALHRKIRRYEYKPSNQPRVP